MKPLTHRQQQILDFLRGHVSEYGYPPTLREIAGRFGLSGPRASVKHLDALERKGHIRRSPGSSRGIDILPGSGFSGSPDKRDVLNGVGVPILGTVPAGPLDLAFQEKEDSLILDPSVADDESFLLRVKGDSMTGDNILPGDMILVRKEETAAEGELVVVLIGEEATLKRFRREGRKLTLLPSNPDHLPVTVDAGAEDVRIVGKVRAVIRIAGR